MAKKVTYAKFHQGLFVPGLGNIGDTLPTTAASGKALQVSMTLDTDGLSVEASDKKGGKASFVVPLPNIVVAVTDSPTADTYAKTK